MNLQEAYKVMQANCGIEVGDTVKVLRKADSRENGWGLPWCESLNSFVGREVVALDIHVDRGVQISQNRGDGALRVPFFVLELVKKGKKLPEPIRISSQYQCEFKEDGSIAVGCQSLDFDLIEKIYMTAKGLKEG